MKRNLKILCFLKKVINPMIKCTLLLKDKLAFICRSKSISLKKVINKEQNMDSKLLNYQTGKVLVKKRFCQKNKYNIFLILGNYLEKNSNRDNRNIN